MGVRIMKNQKSIYIPKFMEIIYYIGDKQVFYNHISNNIKMNYSNVLGILKQLFDLGIVEKINDKKIKKVCLTTKGLELYQGIKILFKTLELEE
jgi:predicted transcriptional regulator